MIRLLFLFVVVALVMAVGVMIFRALRQADVDWTGVTFAAGFVALAFYLSHVTGIGWL